MSNQQRAHGYPRFVEFGRAPERQADTMQHARAEGAVSMEQIERMMARLFGKPYRPRPGVYEWGDVVETTGEVVDVKALPDGTA